MRMGKKVLDDDALAKADIDIEEIEAIEEEEIA